MVSELLKLKEQIFKNYFVFICVNLKDPKFDLPTKEKLIGPKGEFVEGYQLSKEAVLFLEKNEMMNKVIQTVDQQ